MKIEEGNIADLLVAMQKIPEFEPQKYSLMDYERRLNPSGLILLAKKADQLLGFKAGYPLKNTTFYSWLGGVLPEHRNTGVATLLLQAMETKAKELGKSYLSMKTTHAFPAMLTFALKNGFEVIKTADKIELVKKLGI